MNAEASFHLTVTVVGGVRSGWVVDESCAGLCLDHHSRWIVVIVGVAGYQFAMLAHASRDLGGRQGLLFADVVTALGSQKIASSSMLWKLCEALHEALHLIMHPLRSV
jgi:anaerobic glycerol-3-phosphate dehydrogenase